MYDLRISPFFSVNGRLRPCIFDLGGYVYSLRQGVEHIFDVTPQSVLKSESPLSQASSSKATSSSSAKRRSPHQLKPRPCLVWKVDQQTAEILVMASFDDIDPLDQDKLRSAVPRELLMKKLLLVSSESLRKQQGMFPGDGLAKLKRDKDTYIILVPVIVSLKRSWSKQLRMGPLNRQQMLYINNKLKELAVEVVEGLDAHEKLIEQFDFTMGNIVNCDENDNNSSSSSSSLPRARTNFLNNISLNKNHDVKKWLNDSE